MTHLETIRAAVIKANPSILNLEFGCELLRHSDTSDFNKKYYVLERANFGNDQVHVSSIPFGDMTVRMEKDDIKNGGEFEILGRPIRLADVVNTVVKQMGGNYDSIGRIFPAGLGTHILDIVRFWNLLDDNLDHQSPETLSFLALLLA